MQIVI